MASKCTKSKVKKPLETTMGKASCQDVKDVDLSHIQKPLHTSIYGIKDVIELFQRSTNEVKNYITYECDILYECRICRTIFRSLANFILHKRSYCLERFNVASDMKDDFEYEKVEMAELCKPTEDNPISSNIVVDKQNSKKSIGDVTKMLKERLQSSTDPPCNTIQINDASSGVNSVLLEPIENNSAAVFQTAFKFGKEMTDYMKSEVMEIHGILNNDEAILDCTGKIATFPRNERYARELPYCKECGVKFSTNKTLESHVKYKHNTTRLIYLCPLCRETYANAWSVYRHLYKFHRKTTSQVKKLRDQIHNNCIRKDQEPPKKKDKNSPEKQEKISEDDQWLDNVEADNDLQMCGGCGKRFGRKAALHSHSQMCVKRIAFCNSIKENAKRKEAEEKERKNASKLEKDKNVDIIACDIKIEEVEKEASTKDIIGELKVNLKRLSPQTLSSPISNNTINVLNCDVNTSDDVPDENSAKSQIPRFISDSDDDSQKSLSLANKQNIDSMDTESVLKIIGITSNYGQIRVKPSNSDLFVNPTPLSGSETSDPVVEDFEQSRPSSSGQVSVTEQEIETEVESIFQKFDQPYSVSYDSIKKPKKIGKKRTRSTEGNSSSSKLFKLNEENILLDDVDVNFVKYAGPYMDQENLSCTWCELTFSSLSLLFWHMSAHFSWYRFQCSKCNYVSFNKFDCYKHAINEHEVTEDYMQNVVIPIPNWKIALMSHEFAPLSEECYLPRKYVQEIVLEDTNQKNDSNKLTLEPIIEDEHEKFDLNIVKTEFCENEQVPSETQEENKIIANNINERPVRNRVKSCKIAQNDFLYDLGEALKLHESSARKSRKATKTPPNSVNPKAKEGSSSSNEKDKNNVIKPVRVYSRFLNVQAGK